MRRAVLALGGTVAGLAALFSYKTHVPTVTALSTPVTPGTESATSPSMSPSGTTPTMKPPASTPTATKSASAKATAKKTTAPATTPAHTTMTTAPATTKAPAPTHSATPTTPASSAPSGPSGTFSGQTADTNYGPVQVTITVSNGKITNATNDDGGDSIAQNASYQLDQEAVQAQSANIQSVSGATYTSQGYIQSLQSAIDSAGL